MIVCRAVLALVASALLAGAPAHAQSMLRVVPETLSRILDPHFTTSFTTRDFGYLVFDTLFAVDDHFEPKPQMVENYKLSDDKLTYTFVLRPGLKWHDGQPVTAADCVASIRRWASRDSMGQTLTKFIASLDAADAGTIKLVLKEPYGLVLDSLAKVGAPVPFMMPERIARTPGSEQVKEIIGSGPYRFRADLHEPGVKIVLEKFADYKPRSEPPNWASGGKIAKLDRVEMLGIPDAQTQLSALIRGEVDYLERVPADLLPLIDAKSGAKAEVVSKFGFQAIMRMNHLQPPFDNLKVRQAIAPRRLNTKPVNEGGWNIAHTTNTVPDQGNPLSNPFLVAVGPPASAWGWPTDAKTEELRLKFATASDAAYRKAVAAEIQA